MPILQGIKLEIISKNELQIFPEFLHVGASRSTDISAEQEPLGARSACPREHFLAESRDEYMTDGGMSISVYIPALSNAPFFLRYHILESAPNNIPFYYFKLLMNGREITSWGCSSHKATTGQVTRALFDPSDYWTYEDDNGQIYKRCGLEPRSFSFFRYGPSSSPATDGGLIEIRVFRSKGRLRRIQEPATYKNQDTYGITLTSNGLLDEPQNAKFYDYHLNDPTDNPYTIFKFHYRSWESLATLNLIPENHPHRLLPMTPSLQDLSGHSQITQKVLQEQNFTPYTHQNVDISECLRDAAMLSRERLMYNRDKVIEYYSDSSSDISPPESPSSDDSDSDFEHGIEETIGYSKHLASRIAGSQPLWVNDTDETARGYHNEKPLAEGLFSVSGQLILQSTDKSTPNSDVCEPNLMSLSSQLSAPLPAGVPMGASLLMGSARLATIKSKITENLRLNKVTTKRLTSRSPSENIRPLPKIPTRKPSLSSRPLPGPFRSGYGRGKPGFAASRTQSRLPTIHSEDSDSEKRSEPSPIPKSDPRHRPRLECSTKDNSDIDDSTPPPTSKFNITIETHTQNIRTPGPDSRVDFTGIPVIRPSLVSKFNPIELKRETSQSSIKERLFSGDNTPLETLKIYDSKIVTDTSSDEAADTPNVHKTARVWELAISTSKLNTMNTKPFTLSTKDKVPVVKYNEKYEEISVLPLLDTVAKRPLTPPGTAFNAEECILTDRHISSTCFKNGSVSTTPETSKNFEPICDESKEAGRSEEPFFKDHEMQNHVFTNDKSQGRECQSSIVEPCGYIHDAQWMNRTISPAIFAPHAPHHGPRLGIDPPTDHDMAPASRGK